MSLAAAGADVDDPQPRDERKRPQSRERINEVAAVETALIDLSGDVAPEGRFNYRFEAK